MNRYKREKKMTMKMWQNKWQCAIAAMLLAAVLPMSGWSATVSASGGDVVYDIQEGNIPYRVHVFTNTGSAMLTISNGGFMDCLLVGGGGGGGETIGGGGGGGGVIETLGLSVTSGVYTVTVGVGGAGGSGTGYPAGGRGGDSTFNILTSVGGGAGAGYNLPASETGGSAGGNGGGGGARAGYTVGQGSDGGVHWGGNAGGGGGGAGATGANASALGGGNGGNGRATAFKGVSTYYGGGGGGGTRNTTGPDAGTGGLGGGGDGGRSTVGQNGAANTGGGGGGGGYVGDLAGGQGGSGIVIVRFASGPVMPVSSVTLADPVTDSTRLTNTNGVKIAAFPTYAGYDSFQCTGESNSLFAIDAAGWSSTNAIFEYDATFVRPAADTNITLYVWFTNTTDTAQTLLRSTGQIYYTTTAPVPAVRPTLTREQLPGTHAIITAEDLDIGSSGGVANGINMSLYARKAVAINTEDDLTPNETYVTLPSVVGDYPLQLWLQNEVGNTITSMATCLVSVVEYSGTNSWTGAGLTDRWREGVNWSAGLPTAGQNVAITSATAAVTIDATCPALASFTMTAGTLTFTNWATCLRAETVDLRGGMITLPPAFAESDMSNRVWIVCGKDFLLGSNAVITVNAKGYQSMNGPGRGVAGGGGGYGGQGGMDYYGKPGGSLYGVANEPIAAGSGGGTSTGFGLGGYGGGAVRIEALDRVIVNGTILAKGGDGTSRSGGGSGGGIFIGCDTFGGTGLIQANGGSSSAGRGGGGGGGRIAVAYTKSASSQAVRFSTMPGPGWNYGIHEHEVTAGTVWLSNANLLSETMTGWLFAGVRLYVEGLTAWNVNSLTVSNCSFTFAEDGFRLTVTNSLRIDTNGSLGLGTCGTTSCVELACGGDLTLTNGGSLFVYSGETNASVSYGALVSVSNTLSVGSGSWVNIFSHLSSGGSPLFRVRSLVVEGGANGGFNADGKGYRSETGPGRGVTGREGGSGGGYGGQGGMDYYSHNGGSFYGLANEPFPAGSGGGAMTAWSHIGGYGGGAIRIEALAGVTLNGTITANGGNGTDRSGGGSGGGIYIVCDTFGGTGGRIQANGGSSSSRGGGGGGGRIAVWYDMPEWVRAQVREGSMPRSVLITNVCAKYSGLLSVNPGTGFKNLPDQKGAHPGTAIFLQYKPNGTLFILR